MERGCTAPVTYVDVKGYVYCTRHGQQRQSSQRCRKLTPFELRRLQAGETIAYQRYSASFPLDDPRD